MQELRYQPTIHSYGVRLRVAPIAGLKASYAVSLWGRPLGSVNIVTPRIMTPAATIVMAGIGLLLKPKSKDEAPKRRPTA